MTLELRKHDLGFVFQNKCNRDVNVNVAYLENVFLQLKEIKTFRLAAKTPKAKET